MKKTLLFLLLLGAFSSKAQQIEEEDDDNENREKRAQYELRNILPPNLKTKVVSSNGKPSVTPFFSKQYSLISSANILVVDS